jgi:8-oxo-dGTP diphosphatase
VARVQVLAAGGIVLRCEQPPRVAVVRLRKRDEWVLPKGKLDDGETPRAAARREVLEETGYHVTVHEFLGTLVYESGGRSKVVHYWSMEASGEPTHKLMSDIRAVDWLPLGAAVERLSRDPERAFLEAVGPLAVNALARRVRAKATVAQEPAATAPAARRRRGRAVTPEFGSIEPSSIEAVPQLVQSRLVPETDERTSASDEMPAVEPLAEIDATDPVDGRRRNFAQRLRGWLGRAW